MRSMTRKMGIALGAALTALLLVGLGKAWAGAADRPASSGDPQTISKNEKIAATAGAPDTDTRMWRRGRRRGH